MASGWSELVAQLVEDYDGGNRSAFARRVGTSPQRVNGWLAGETPEVGYVRDVARGTSLPLPRLLSIAYDIPMPEIARGASVDVLSSDDALDEQERTHIVAQYSMLLRSTMVARAVADALADHERDTGQQLDPEHDVNVRIEDGRVLVELKVPRRIGRLTTEAAPPQIAAELHDDDG